jgi:LysR family glycine cleavage system transcriptional activator
MKIHPLPPLKAVVAFEATARHASFSKAALELNVTQGAISRQILQLELCLGAHLLDRTTRTVKLSRTGEQYFQAVQYSLRGLAQATGQIKHWQGKQQVTVATSTALASLWLLPRISEFNSLHEEVELRIVAYDHVTDFSKIDCDLAFYYCKTPPLNMRATPICSEEIFPVCSPAYLARHKNLKSSEDLSECTWLCLDWSAKDWVTWQDWFSMQGLPVEKAKHRININSYSMLIQAALSGQGVALGWRNLIQMYLDSGALVQAIPATLKTGAPFCLLEKPEVTNSRKCVEDLKNWLLELN